MRSIERKKHAVEHIDTEGSWAISYGDMITLLLSFFVLYFTVDHSKVKSNKLQDALMIQLTQSGMKANVEDGLKQQLNIGLTPGQGVEPEIMKKFGAQVFRDDQNLVVNFDNTSFFDLGNTDINSDGLKALSEFAKIYTPFSANYQLRIQAYTDTRKVRTTNLRYRDNLELSALRSVSAMRALQKAGLPLSHMKIAGYGEIEEIQNKLLEIQKEKDPLKFSRKVVLVIEPLKGKSSL